MTRMAPQDQPHLPSPFSGRGRIPGGRSDPHQRLRRCLLHLAGAHACIEAASSRPWASATFQGSRHEIVLRIGGDASAATLAALVAKVPEAEFVIAGHIVADISVDRQETGVDPDGYPYARLSLSALIIEDW